MDESVEKMEVAETKDAPELDGGEPEEAYRGDSHPGTSQGCTVQTKSQRRPHCGLRPDTPVALRSAGSRQFLVRSPLAVRASLITRTYGWL